jgi:hypothetical protein
MGHVHGRAVTLCTGMQINAGPVSPACSAKDAPVVVAIAVKLPKDQRAVWTRSRSPEPNAAICASSMHHISWNWTPPRHDCVQSNEEAAEVYLALCTASLFEGL